MTATVGFLDMPTHSALLAGVFRVHQDNRDTGQSRLVVDELPQLGEAPIAVSRSLLGSSSPGPRANAGQVFQGNRAVRALSFCYETLANLVVDVFLEAALAAREFPQVAFGRQAAARLQVGTELLHPLAVALDRCAGQHVAVAGGGNVGHAQIDAQRGFHVARLRVGDFARRQQEEHPIPKHEVRLALAVRQLDDLPQMGEAEFPLRRERSFDQAGENWLPWRCIRAAEDEVVAAANATEFGLASYFLSRDIGRVFRVGEALEYGMVGINTGLISTAEVPFGGVKQSGLGREGARQGIEDYVEIKYLCLGDIQR